MSKSLLQKARENRINALKAVRARNASNILHLGKARPRGQLLDSDALEFASRKADGKLRSIARGQLVA